MAKIIKLEPRRARREHDRKDARAKALQASLREARLEHKKLQDTQQQSTQKLLSIFKARNPRKPTPPSGGK